MSEWFGSWFDSPYYHKLYNNRDFNEAEKFISKLIEYLEPHNSATFLDLACGRGRHSVHLNKLGLFVSGADYSANSIKEAKAFENDDLKFYEHDMRTPFTNKYNYILNLFTSFGYFNTEKEHIDTLKHIYNGLHQNGIFVLDYLNSVFVVDNLVKKETIQRDHLNFHITRKVEDNKIKKTISFKDQKEYIFEESVMAFNYSSLIRLNADIGFKLMDCFGDYNLSSYKESTSQRLILIFKKC